MKKSGFIRLGCVPEDNTERFHGWSRFSNAIISKMTHISEKSLHVYLAIAMHQNRYGTAFPSVKRIADLCRCTERTVYRALKELEKAFLIKRIHRAGTSTMYAIIGTETTNNGDDIACVSTDTIESPPTSGMTAAMSVLTAAASP